MRVSAWILFCAIIFLTIMPSAIRSAVQKNSEPNHSAVLQKLQDSKYFRETFFWIVDRDERTVPFIQNSVQKKYYLEKTPNDLILKARHLGFSSEIEGDDLHACMFTENTNAVMMSHTMDDTLIHRHRVDFYRKKMGTKDFPIEVMVETDNVKELYFPATNSYYWIGAAGATGFGRGRQITRLHLSELAHWPDQSVLTAMFNARSRNALTRMETTANGMGEKFSELWFESDAPANRSPWKQHFFAWWMDEQNVLPLRAGEKFEPSGDERRIREKVEEIYKIVLRDDQLNWWRTERSRQADKTLMAQEHPSYPREAFISSGRHVFNLGNLEVMEKRVNEPLFVGRLEDNGKEIRPVDDPEGELTIWTPPKEGHRYFIPADVAEGVKDGAWSVAPVFDRSGRMEVVAELRLRCDPGEFGRALVTLGEYYWWAVLAPERNNMGTATIEAIKAMGYPHLLKTTDLWPDDPEKEGFPTDEFSKTKAITAYRNAIDQLSFFENSKVAIAEARSAVWDVNGKMVSERAQSKTGQERKKLYLDCVMTRCIGLYCLKFLTMDESYRDSDGSPVKVGGARKPTRYNSNRLRVT